jgi:hypothetical protein
MTLNGFEPIRIDLDHRHRPFAHHNGKLLSWGVARLDLVHDLLGCHALRLWLRLTRPTDALPTILSQRITATDGPPLAAYGASERRMSDSRHRRIGGLMTLTRHGSGVH